MEVSNVCDFLNHFLAQLFRPRCNLFLEREVYVYGVCLEGEPVVNWFIKCPYKQV